MSNPSVSIIISTRDRAQSLKETLAALSHLRIPRDWSVEIVVVDNGSRDQTKNVVNGAIAPDGAQIHYLYESRFGKSIALNTAVKLSKGSVLLFVDDDVKMKPSWLEQMSCPILDAQADAVQGGIVIPNHLQRDWMTL